MNTHVHEDRLTRISDSSHAGTELIGKPTGATNRFCMGIASYFLETYGEPGVHDIQECFYVVEGTGVAKLGDEEFDIRPGSAFLAQKGVPHSIKKNPGSVPVKLVWAHGAL